MPRHEFPSAPPSRRTPAGARERSRPAVATVRPESHRPGDTPPHAGDANPTAPETLDVRPGVRGLIFDVDGTLADTMPLHYQAWRQVLSDVGIDYPLAVFHQLAGMPTRAIVPVVNRYFHVHLDPEVTARRKESLFLRRLQEIIPIEPVAAVVRRYAGVLPMSIGTGGGRAIIRRILTAIGLAGFFEIVVTAEDVMNPKPAPDTWLLCAQRMGVPAQDCQVFEDGDLGLEGARRAGMIATDVRPFLAPHARVSC